MLGIGIIPGYLNQPHVKAGIKFVLGGIRLWKTEEELRTSLPENQQERWVCLAERVAMIGQVVTSSPLRGVIGRCIGYLFETESLVSLFGPNIHFVGNPTHPRHLISIASAIILFAIAIFRASNDLPQNRAALFAFVTSRPVLHLVNAIGTP